MTQQERRFLGQNLPKIADLGKNQKIYGCNWQCPREHPVKKACAGHQNGNNQNLLAGNGPFWSVGTNPCWALSQRPSCRS